MQPKRRANVSHSPLVHDPTAGPVRACAVIGCLGARGKSNGNDGLFMRAVRQGSSAELKVRYVKRCNAIRNRMFERKLEKNGWRVLCHRGPRRDRGWRSRQASSSANLWGRNDQLQLYCRIDSAATTLATNMLSRSTLS